MTTQEISSILHEHAKWLKGEGGKCANLDGANLDGANLDGANLDDANLCDAMNFKLPIACPDTGEFIGWKKANGYIVKLLIPEDAKRLSATGRKCRCNKAKVLEIQVLDGSQADISEVRSGYDHDFVYTAGETVRVDNFDDDRWNECSTGIHFFITREEAVNYNL